VREAGCVKRDETLSPLPLLWTMIWISCGTFRTHENAIRPNPIALLTNSDRHSLFPKSRSTNTARQHCSPTKGRHAHAITAIGTFWVGRGRPSALAPGHLRRRRVRPLVLPRASGFRGAAPLRCRARETALGGRRMTSFGVSRRATPPYPAARVPYPQNPSGACRHGPRYRVAGSPPPGRSGRAGSTERGCNGRWARASTH